MGRQGTRVFWGNAPARESSPAVWGRYPVDAPTPDAAAAAALPETHDSLLHALEQTRWNRMKAAKLLQISYRALLYKIKAAGFDQVPAV
jgi:two-component system response regulator AtoC